MYYLIKSPWWLKKLHKNYTWSIEGKGNSIYLSFDDGPHPETTPFVLDELKKYGTKATFFCIGKNVVAYPELYQRIIEEGHAVGNHTYNHLNGWKTPDKNYLEDIALAKKYIDSNLYRPPYGKISSFQQKQLRSPRFNLTTIMWSVLSGDFDEKISREQCLENVILNSKAGSIIVFHDSTKAFDRMRYALSGALKFFTEKKYKLDKITTDIIQTGDKKDGPG